MILSSGPSLSFDGGQFGFVLTGQSRQLVVVETSTDLVNWLPLWTNTIPFPAALNFSDPQSGVSSHRFYRAHVPYPPAPKIQPINPTVSIPISKRSPKTAPT